LARQVIQTVKIANAAMATVRADVGREFTDLQR